MSGNYSVHSLANEGQINMKMYILVRDDVPLGIAIVAVAHALLSGYLKYR